MKHYGEYITQSNNGDFAKKVKDLILYRKILKAEKLDDQEAMLTLDDGTQLILVGNEGCGGCGYGWFYIDELNECDNIITKVECVCENVGEYEDDYIYHLFVYAEDKKINAVQYSGCDNGYYGTGYDLYVKARHKSESMNINELAQDIHNNAVAHGWWEDERSVAEIVALCHSELSEALEAYRKGESLVWDNDGKPDGIAVEMVDCVIRIFDYLAREKVDIEQIIRIKHEYNKTRPYKHGGKKI